MSEAGSRLLRTGEVADLLQCSKWCVNHLVRRGKLKALRFGNGRRFRMADLERFMALSEETTGTRRAKRRRRAGKPTEADTAAPDPGAS